MNSPAMTTPIPGGGWFACSFPLSGFTMVVFPCMCGHLSMEALPTSTFGVVLAWFPFIRYQRTRIFDQCLAVFFVVFSTLVFTKNVADVLWFGHNPLLQ